MKRLFLLPLLIFMFMMLSGCDEDVVSSNNPRLVFFAVEGETHLPIHIIVDSDTVGTITEPTIFTGEFPDLNDTTLLIVEITKGNHSYEATTNKTYGEIDFVEEGLHLEGLAIIGDLDADIYDYYIPLDFGN